MRTLHIISHTHWDREWYLTFQQFRLKLVHLIDGLLDILEKDPEFKYFMLDGQTIVLDDYLYMRPEKEAILRAHIRKGRIVIGPWHILPDMFLVGPESHIRNLLQGDRTARKFGLKMMVGYIPDPFGHPGQVPQILRGFGIDTACLWRGLDEEPAEFWWQSPDGSRVLMVYLRDSYSNGASLPVGNLPAFAEAVSAQGASLAAHSVASDHLIMFGTDHMEPPRNTAEAIAYADEMLNTTHVVHSTLPRFISAVQTALKNNKSEIPTVAGELRACKRMHLLPGVLSTRMWIKQRNHACENLLTKWAEPFTTFQEFATGNNSPSKIINQKSEILHQAWRLLMENHPHDSICGCSIDQVHDEMKPRFDQVEQIGEELTRQSLAAIADNVTTNSQPSAATAIVLFNPSSFTRTDAVSVEFSLPPETTAFEIVDEAGRTIPHETTGLGTQEFINSILDPAGFRNAFGMVNEGRVSGLGVRAFTVRREGPTAHLDVILAEGEPEKSAWERGVKGTLTLLDDTTVTAFHVRARTADMVKAMFIAPEIPGLGWRTFYIRARQAESAPVTLSRLVRAVPPFAGRIAITAFVKSLITRLQGEPASKPPYIIENDFFKIEVESKGTLTVTDKKNGIIYHGQNRFVDGGDCGDEYNYSPPASDDPQPVPRLKSVTVHRGPARQTLTLTFSLKVPAQLSTDRKARLKETVELPIISRISLSRGVSRVDIHTDVENKARDHRLRVHFPAPFNVNAADHDSHFEVISRRIGVPEFDRQTWVEDPRPEVPQRAFTDVSDGKHGLMLANRGLPEVEVLRQTNGEVEIALTLLRCVGWLSRDDFITRRGHAGPAMETPGAQMLGKWSFDYSIIPHAGRNHILTHELAHAFDTPLRAISTALHEGCLPCEGSFVDLEGEEFVVSAVKQSEDRRGWLIRGYNIGGSETQVTIKPWRAFKHIERINLAEEKQLDLKPAPDGRVAVAVRGHEIITLLFRE